MGRPSLLRLLTATVLAVGCFFAGMLYAGGDRIGAAALAGVSFGAFLGVLYEAADAKAQAQSEGRDA